MEGRGRVKIDSETVVEEKLMDGVEGAEEREWRVRGGSKKRVMERVKGSKGGEGIKEGGGGKG